ncbi:hypothetical protein AVEN_118580-1 [Araneus ventricosus]|uniref:Cuticle protein 10.9 n=1 Tax=Araneus ventricosus TaxID=182803 RepID=A0A4Y2AZ82_ARAVE|nr:hypothetical protein AVEN_118580-1 [Araneus ventricosus]
MKSPQTYIKSRYQDTRITTIFFSPAALSAFFHFQSTTIMFLFGFSAIAFATLAIVSAFQNPASSVRQEVLVQPPQPYDFAYKTADDRGTRQHRTESADSSGTVTGSYGYVDPFGMYRRVEYVADVDGYRTTVHSNEPGMTSNGAANAAYFVEVPPPAIVAQGLAYLKPVQEAQL